MPSEVLDAAMYHLPMLLHNWYSDTMDYDSCDNGSPSEEIWNKFDLNNLTPPLSPAHKISTTVSNFHPDECPVDDFVDPSLTSPPPLPDLKDTCSEIFDKELAVANCLSKIRKDCMWNGRATDSLSVPTHRLNRSASPASLSGSPASTGCIDPRSLFNSNQLPDRLKPTAGCRLLSVSGSETPSDSEEEVDVVTIEKKQTPLKPVTNLGLLPNGTRFYSTLVQQNGAHSQFALINPNGSRSEQPIKSNHRTVSMVVTNSENKNGKKTFHLKCVPVAKSVADQNLISNKRKLSSEKPHGTVFHLMKLTPTPASQEENNATSLKKRKVLSLDGVSMVSDTGIKRNSSQNQSTPKYEEETQVINNILASEVKKTKKSTKKFSSSSDEDPITNSPRSSEKNLTLPKKRSRLNRSTTSSSGSDEESTRVAHNYLERQRRKGLRNLYHKLREVVPEVADSEKAAKVNILKKAKDHVIDLQKKNDELIVTKSSEQEKRQRLQLRLKKLADELVCFRSLSLH